MGYPTGSKRSFSADRGWRLNDFAIRTIPAHSAGWGSFREVLIQKICLKAFQAEASGFNVLAGKTSHSKVTADAYR